MSVEDASLSVSDWLLEMGAMLLRSFQSCLHKRPLLTQMVSSGIIAGTGDMVSQLVLEKRNRSNYDYWRTGRFFVITSFFIAPCLNRWFHLLEKIQGGPAKLLPLKRLIVDQLTFAPFFNGVILYNLRVLEGFSLDDSWKMMKNDWWTIYSNSLKVWPMVQLFNFYLVPLNMRVIVVQIVALFWNTFLSYKTQKKLDSSDV